MVRIFYTAVFKRKFFVGKNEILSERFGDVTKNQATAEGYAVIDTQGIRFVKDIRNKVKAYHEINPKLSLKKFSLETP